MTLRWFVAGVPATKGSTEIVRGRGGRPVVKATNREAQQSWAGHVAAAARKAWDQDAPTPGPFHVETTFILPITARRKSVITHQAGDLDKLERCVWDALTGVVYVDDVQVVSCASRKRMALPGEQPGCWITVVLLDDPDA